MWEDPIVSEVRQVRERLTAAFDYDIAAIFADLSTRQEALGERLVRPGQKAPRAPESNPAIQHLETEPPRAIG